ncbi:MAG: hypothetical protein GXP39_12050 [Chloroflexi bacterium]|nr:hypothetical protein [Chloroflexota bacterium]
MSNTGATIALGAILLVFGWIGFKRGLRAEISTLMLIISSRVLISRWGDQIVWWTNNLYRGALFVLKGGLSAQDPGQVFVAIRQAPPLISADFKPTYLVGLSVLAIILAYAISRLPLFRTGSSLLGALVGMINGYVVVQFFLRLLPRELPEPLALVAGRSSVTGGDQIRAATAPIRGLVGEYGSYLALAVIGGILFLVVNSIRPEKGGGS